VKVYFTIPVSESEKENAIKIKAGLHHNYPLVPTTKTPILSNLSIINNIMNLTKSVRELAADINAAPDNYDSNDDVSEKCLSVEAEFDAAGILRH
jgi:hypothetical protein